MALTNDFRQKIQDGATTSSGSVQNNQPLDTKGFNEWVNPTPKASVVTQVKDIGNQMGNTYQETAKNTIENAKTALGPSQTADTGSFGSNFLADLSKRLSATGHIAGDIAGAALAPVMHTITALIPPEIKKDSEAAVNWVADKITNSPQITEHLNKINNALDANPDLKKSLMSDLPNALALLGGNKVNELNPEVNMGGVTKDLGTIKDTIGKVPSKVQGAIDNTLKTDGSSGAGNIKLNIAKGNVNPQLESSAGRLSGDNPVASYDTYLSQSKNALKDIKADPAISSVGEKIGNAFESVIKERSNVGKTLGDELKTVGKNKVSITEPKTNLLSELKDSGLSYNPKTKQLTSFQGSKFASDEVAMLDNYQKGVNALGDTPTVSQIDNFISKTRTELDLAKGKSGVTGATNAERIIKGNLAKLRESLDPSIPGNEALSKYWEANKKYSDLSDFIEEGSGFLGKKTQSGDFAKDASMAKSSVQSILNNGKKDWMARLEDLTGYKAIDDSVLALQAMKDAGDFRGLSLLQTMSESGIPTSKAGFAQKVIDFVAKKGGELIAGTPEEQTRAFLKDLVEKQGKADLKGKGTIPENSIKPVEMPPGLDTETNKLLSNLKDEAQRRNYDFEKISNEVKAAIDKVPSAKEYVDSQLDEVVKGDKNLIAVKAPIKSFNRTLEKTILEAEGGDIADIKDLARNTVIPLDDAAKASAISKMDARPDIFRKKIQTPEKFMGYEGIIYNIKTPEGLIAETQVVSPKMIYGKMPEVDARRFLGDEMYNQIEKEVGVKGGEGHIIYENFRKLSPTQQLSAKGQNLIKESMDYYAKLR